MEDAATVQPELLADVAPLVATSGPDEPLAAAFHGTVREDAVVIDGDAQVRLQLVLEQHIAHHPQAVPLLVTWHLPSQGDYWATRQWADSLRARLRAGAHAVAVGNGLESGHHHKQPVFRLLHVRGVTPEPRAGQAGAHLEP